MGSFLEPRSSPIRIETTTVPANARAVERIGHYRLLQRIGAGGMGEVWKAEQTEPVRRIVALKLIKAGMDSSQILARFDAERQALAMMDHPYIATVHDAGVTEAGRSYFVMEFVPGIPVTDYCDQRRLDTKERLALFRKVCEGVQHAHGKAIIHRDLKPANILVSDVDGRPFPKIIDFGVAKATTRKLTDRTVHTALGQVIGTPEYMSPEQADLTSEDVDARTDVYSLGVVLYELLVGALPFESEELRKGGLEGILRTLKEREPSRPSTRITALGAKAVDIARSRRTEPRRLVGELKGSLDWIVLRALEKDRNRRYGSPAELAKDIERHLRDEPVAARPPSAVYRSRKYVKRHRVGVGFAATVVLALAVGFVAAGVRGGFHGHEHDLPRGRPTRVTDGEAWEGMPVLSPDGSQIAYVSDASGNLDIYVTDVGGGEPLRLTQDPAEDRRPFWFPDGRSVGFTSGRGGSWGIWKVERLGGRPTLFLPHAKDGVLSPDGDRVAAQVQIDDGASGIAVLGLVPGEQRTVTHARGGFWSHETPVWSPDGRFLCYADFQSLWIVPSDGGAPRRPIEGLHFNSQPAWSPSGRHIYFSSLRGGTQAIWRLEVSSGKVERVTMGTGPESWPSLSTDGKKLAYGTGEADRDVVLLDRERDTTTRLPGVSQVMSVAPAGDRVLYVHRGASGQADLWELSLEDGRPVPPARRLTDHPGISSNPDLSPDGRWIAYYRVVDGRRWVCVMPSRGGEPRPVDDGSGAGVLPVWSPDGSRLAYVSDREGTQRVWVVDIEDGEAVGSPRPVSPEGVQVFGAAWSPDGRLIAYVGLTGERTEVFVIAAEGGDPRQVTVRADAQRVRWDPVTGYLLVSGGWGEGRFRLRWVPPDGGPAMQFEPEVEFGGQDEPPLFDVDGSGRFLVYARSHLRGDIWVLEAEEGSY